MTLCPSDEFVVCKAPGMRPALHMSGTQFGSVLLGEPDQARLIALNAPHSSDWLFALSVTSYGLRLSDEAIDSFCCRSTTRPQHMWTSHLSMWCRRLLEGNKWCRVRKVAAGQHIITGAMTWYDEHWNALTSSPLMNSRVFWGDGKHPMAWSWSPDIVDDSSPGTPLWQTGPWYLSAVISDEEYSLILLEFEMFTRKKEDLTINSKTSLEKTGNYIETTVYDRV